MIRNLPIMVLIFSLLILVSGCSKKSTDVNDEDPYADFGGFTPEDETPAFNDSELLTEIEGDESFDDNILTSPTVDSIISDAEESGTYALRILWGSMEYDSTVTELTDWTGSLTVSRGVEIIRRVIRFEMVQDSILPRTEYNLIEWISKTNVHHDGIFVNLYIPPPDTSDDSFTNEPVTVTFDTEPFTITFNITELVALDTIFHLDDSINAVSFRGIKIYPKACPKGFMEGRWGRNDDGDGVFIGRWISQHGALAGHVKGRWGVDTNGNNTNMFYGKWIDLTGKFKGFLKGEYKPRGNLGNAGGNSDGTAMAPCVGGGWLRGQIYNANKIAIGAMRGHYLMPRRNDDAGFGYFQARWRTFCPNTEPEDDGIGQ